MGMEGVPPFNRPPPLVPSKLAAAPPPPRSGLAIRAPALMRLLRPPGPTAPLATMFLDEILAASRRSFTAASWASNLMHRISIALYHTNHAFNVPMVGLGQLLLTLVQQAFQTEYSFISGNQLSLCYSDFLFQACVLIDQLSLYNSKLFQISFQECHLLLLLSVIT